MARFLPCQKMNIRVFSSELKEDIRLELAFESPNCQKTNLSGLTQNEVVRNPVGCVLIENSEVISCNNPHGCSSSDLSGALEVIVWQYTFVIKSLCLGFGTHNIMSGVEWLEIYGKITTDWQKKTIFGSSGVSDKEQKRSKKVDSLTISDKKNGLSTSTVMVRSRTDVSDFFK
ncbi:hypothetical protein V8G54_014968 [Vigna mungo]|uniref:Uncharacterized protein n=1 Tax=Vigna mungo TaxID=3915 RepID=A0AAQ3NKC4_VIGMU